MKRRESSRKPWVVVLAAALLLAALSAWWGAHHARVPDPAGPPEVVQTLPPTPTPIPIPSRIVSVEIEPATPDAPSAVAADDDIDGATLLVTILANVRGHVPPGATLTCRPVESGYHPNALALTESIPAPDTLITLVPHAAYELTAEATGYLPERRTLIAGQVDAVTFHLNIGGRIAGRVVDDRTGAPLADVPLRLWGRGIQPATMCTDASGAFDYCGLAPGRYAVEPATTTRGVPMRGSTAMPLTLTMAEWREDVTLRLGAGGRIRARLIDPRTGQPWDPDEMKSVYHRSFEVINWWTFTFTCAFPDGNEEKLTMQRENEIAFNRLPDGDYLVTLTFDMEGTVTMMRRAIVADAGEVVLEFPYTPDRTITGYVVDPQGRPVEGAEVRWQEQELVRIFSSPDSGVAEQPTGATGYFALRPSVEEHCTLIATATDWGPGFRYDIFVGARDVRVVLSEGGSLVVEVLDNESRPDLSARVDVERMELLNAIEMDCDEVAVDKAGRARFVHLAEGVYQVTCFIGPERKRYVERLVQVQEGRETRVEIGGSTGVAGTITLDGEPAAGWLVTWRDHAGLVALDQEIEAQCDEDGRFRLLGLPARQRGWIELKGDGDATPWPRREPVQTPRQGVTETKIDLHTTTLTGTVHDARGLPMGDEPIRVRPVPHPRALRHPMLHGDDIITIDHLPECTRSDAYGRFTIAGLLPGEYAVCVGADRENSRAWRPVECGEHGGTRSLEIVVEDTGWLEGHFTVPELNHPVVMLHDDGGLLRGDDVQDDSQGYRMDDVPPGRYRAFVLDFSDSGVYLSPVETIEIRSGETTVQDFRLRPCRLALLSIFDAETGAPVHGAEVRLPRGLEYGGMAEGLLNQCVLALPPGRHRVSVRHPDYRTESVSIDLTKSPRLYLSVPMQAR